MEVPDPAERDVRLPVCKEGVVEEHVHLGQRHSLHPVDSEGPSELKWKLVLHDDPRFLSLNALAHSHDELCLRDSVKLDLQVLLIDAEQRADGSIDETLNFLPELMTGLWREVTDAELKAVLFASGTAC